MAGWIVSVGTAAPPHRLAQADAKRMAERHFGAALPDIDKYLPIFDHALVDERRICATPDGLLAEMNLEARNDLSLEWAERLATEAIAACLAKAGVQAADIDALLFVSSSGIATPSVDARFAGRMGFSRRLRRVPLFGLGCAGGAAGLAIAAEMLESPQIRYALVVAVEINSLTFQTGDYSKQNFVASAIFGDGAAALLMSRAKPTGAALRHAASTALRQPESTGLMGWRFGSSGFRVVFSTRVPEVVAALVPEMMRSFDGELGAGGGPDGFVLHPGGTRILHAFERLFGRGPQEFRDSYEVLRRFGNMSSATVLFVLAERLYDETREKTGTLLLAAFGPGFVAEASLLRWES